MLTEAWMMALTSNSSQKPCLTLSVASAGLLSSRTLLSISAALMRVVLRGFKYSRQEVYNEANSYTYKTILDTGSAVLHRG